MVKKRATTEVITYSLREDQKRSDGYYQEIATFTDEVLAEAEARLGDGVAAFRRYVGESGHEEPRTAPEYIFELLTLGVLWRVYGNATLELGGFAGRLLHRLVLWRRRSDLLKPLIDRARGPLANIFLGRPDVGRDMPPLTLKNLEYLHGWLSAAGDFREEAKRLQHWRTFLARRPAGEAAALLRRVASFGAWFEASSLSRLGRYTPRVEQFLENTHPGYRWREDNIFCGRQRVEYHMNMVGTEIMNRAFREGFLKTRQKVVLVPPCMRAKSASECEAVDTPYGARCAACTPGCRVHQLTKLGEKRGFDVFILPHELNVFSGGKVRPKENGAVGVIGVSCPLTNVTGGWETRDLGVPAQGLLLDYCGCPWHWALDDGIVTDINFKQLLRVMNV